MVNANTAAEGARIRLRFRHAPDGKCIIEYAWANVDTEWHAFGNPVPVIKDGPRKGFEAHDVYHFILLAVCGKSPVLDILMLGANAGYGPGVFGGAPALAEEGMILMWNAARRKNVDFDLCSLLIANAATPAQLREVRARGDKARTYVRNALREKGAVTMRVDGLPLAFRAANIAAREAAWKS